MGCELLKYSLSSLPANLVCPTVTQSSFNRKECYKTLRTSHQFHSYSFLRLSHAECTEYATRTQRIKRSIISSDNICTNFEKSFENSDKPNLQNTRPVNICSTPSRTLPYNLMKGPVSDGHESTFHFYIQGRMFSFFA